MVWKLLVTETAEKQLDKLDKGVQRAIRKYLAEACQLTNPADRGHALTGAWVGFHRYRVGRLRMIVHIERNVITVTLVKIDRRDSIY